MCCRNLLLATSILYLRSWVKLYRKAHVLTKPEVTTLVHALYRDFPSPKDDVIRSVMILSIFTQIKVVTGFDARIPFSYSHSERKAISEAITKLCKKITTQLTTFGLFPLTKLDIMLVLESPIMLSEAPIFKYAQINQKKLGLTENDMHAIAENVVLASLTSNHKVNDRYSYLHCFEILSSCISL